MLPIKNGKITTVFGKLGKSWSTGAHTGVDFAVPIGTPVLAVADGTIVNASWGKAYGNQVIMTAPGGYVIYAHLNKVRVKPGMFVKKGQIVGESGNSGNSTGPHLHLELRDNIRWSSGKAKDPKDLLKA
jgi:murein DD-endopeptidase MepM/ murein hydrolase activator NlpD